jgi:hypothetical protein
MRTAESERPNLGVKLLKRGVWRFLGRHVTNTLVVEPKAGTAPPSGVKLQRIRRWRFASVLEQVVTAPW